MRPIKRDPSHDQLDGRLCAQESPEEVEQLNSVVSWPAFAMEEETDDRVETGIGGFQYNDSDVCGCRTKESEPKYKQGEWR